MSYRSRSRSPRGRSRSRSPPRGSPRGGGGRGPPPGVRETPTGCSLLIRRLAADATVDDVRDAAERYGRVKDVYIPKDFHTGRPRGIAFVEYDDRRDAEDAKEGLDRSIIAGSEVEVQFAMRGRRKPGEGGYGGGGRGGGGRGVGGRGGSSPGGRGGRGFCRR